MNYSVKRIISVLMVMVMCISLMPASAFADDTETSWWEKITGKASEAMDSVANAANNAVDSTKEFISKLSLPDFKKGWKTTAGYFGTTVAALGGQQYVNDVAKAIDALQSNVTNRVQTSGSSLASKAGFAAEEWHAGTYNIDAVAKGIKKSATTGKSNGAGSVDVSVGDELNAGLKYYSTGSESAKQQAKNYIQKYNEYSHNSKNPKSIDDWLADNNFDFKNDSDLYWSIYKDQVRVIPADQIDDAQKFLKEAIAKESAKEGANRQYVKSDYEETLEKLSDRLKTADGTSSVPLSKDDAEAIARAGKENKFDPRDYGITTEKVIKGNYIAKQALKAGTTAAIIEVAVVVGPQIYEIIKHLVETGEIDEDQLKQTGLDGLSAAADGYLKGSISTSLVIMCKAGKLGASFTNASPELIGTMTVLVIDAIRYGIKMANGEMTKEDYIDLMAQELVVGAASLGTAALVGLLFPQATLAICLGSFVGGLVASNGYPAGKEFVLAKIDEADVDMLVPISSSSEAIKGKTSAITAKLTEALDGIKGINIKDVQDKTIKVFDFTQKVAA